MEKTIKNLTKAFIGESQARNRYTIYAKIAREDGFEQIASIFEETADQEREHANWLFKMIGELKGANKNFEEITVEAGSPTTLGSTQENLKAAISGETYEFETMYPKFANDAREKNLGTVAARLLSIAKAEAHHGERYQKLLNELEKNSIFNKEEKIEWVCRKCGYTHLGTNAPEKCPACDHPKAYYQVKSENY